MTSKGNNNHVILSGRHTKHFEENKQHPVFVSMLVFILIEREKIELSLLTTETQKNTTTEHRRYNGPEKCRRCYESHQ